MVHPFFFLIVCCSFPGSTAPAPQRAGRGSLEWGGRGRGRAREVRVPPPFPWLLKTLFLLRCWYLGVFLTRIGIELGSIWGYCFFCVKSVESSPSHQIWWFPFLVVWIITIWKCLVSSEAKDQPSRFGTQVIRGSADYPKNIYIVVRSRHFFLICCPSFGHKLFLFYLPFMFKRRKNNSSVCTLYCFKIF